MYQIEEINKALVSGIDSVQFVPVAGVDSFPEVIDLGVSEMLIILKSGYSWTDIPILEDSATYQDGEQSSSQGIAYEKVLTAFLPHIQRSARNTLQSLRFVDLLVKFRDKSGNHHIVGTPEEPVSVEVGSSVQQLGNSSGYQIAFKGVHTFPGLILTLPDIPQFVINSEGQLVYSEGLEESFSVNSNGELVVTGAQEGRYSLDSRGRLQFS